MDKINYDVEGARRAGYTDDEIADHLASKSGYDLAGAKSAGYPVLDIIAHITGKKPGVRTPGVAPHVNPPVEKSLLGTAYDTAHALGETAKRFGEGVMGTFRMITGGEPKQPGFDPLGDIKSLGSAIVDPIKQHMFQDPDATITQRFVNTAAGLMGGDVEGSAKGYEETGSVLPAMIRKAGVPVVGILAGIGLSALKQPVTATLDSTNAAISLIDPKAMRPMFDPLRASGISPLHMPADVDVMTGAATLAGNKTLTGITKLGDGTTDYTQFSASGIQTMLGAARVSREFRIPAVDTKLGASAPTSTFRAVGASGTVLMPVLQFSKTVQQEVYFIWHVPHDIDITVPAHFHFMWQPGTGWTAGNYVWKLEYLVMDEHGATLLAGTPTTITADVTPVDATTNIETETADDITVILEQYVVCHFYRDVATDSGDDVGSISFFEFQYTANKLGD